MKPPISDGSGGDDDGVSQPKRKRGRPKGSTKKKSAPAKPKAKSGTGNCIVGRVVALCFTIVLICV